MRGIEQMRGGEGVLGEVGGGGGGHDGLWVGSFLLCWLRGVVFYFWARRGMDGCSLNGWEGGVSGFEVVEVR